MNDIFNDNVSLKTETPAFAKHGLQEVRFISYEWLEKQKESQFIKLGWYQMFLLRKQKL